MFCFIRHHNKIPLLQIPICEGFGAKRTKRQRITMKNNKERAFRFQSALIWICESFFCLRHVFLQYILGIPGLAMAIFWERVLSLVLVEFLKGLLKMCWSVFIPVGAQVAKANGGHQKNVWKILRCPQYVLKCNKSVHLPAWESFLCLLGDL